MTQISLNFESLFEILRREKSRPELQQLEKTFFVDFINYLSEKKQILAEKQQKNQDMEEITRLQIQITTTEKIVKELYDRREKKVLNLALMAAHSASVDKVNLHETEEQLFNELLAVIRGFRSGVLSNILKLQLPSIPNSCKKEVDQGEKQETESLLSLIKVLADVPSFVGEELEVYGPFKANDIVLLPKTFAQILIKNNKAEEIKPDSM